MEKTITEIVVQPAKYFWLIVSSMWNSFSGGTKVIKSLFALVSALVVISCLILLALGGIFPRQIDILINDFSSDIRIGFTRLAFGILFLGFIFPLLFLYEASKIHGMQINTILEKAVTIDNLEMELHQEIVNVNLDIYEWERYEQENDTVNKIVCVVVKNMGNEDIRCYGALKYLIRLNNDKSTDNIYGEAIRNDSLISWSGGGADNNQEVLIKAGHERILNVAYGIRNSLVFKMQNLDFEQLKNGIYIFEIEIGGHVDSKKIANQKACFYIEYENLYRPVPVGDSDLIKDSSVIDGYHQYGIASFRKLDIKKRKCENEE